MTFTTKRRITPGLRTLCALATAAITASACSADTTVSSPRQSETVIEETETLEFASRDLNLLQVPQLRGGSVPRVRGTLGGGSYICSPAGFGRKSYCYSN